MHQEMSGQTKILLSLVLTALLVPACSSCLATRSRPGSMSQEEKHRLYSAAMAASESPLDDDLFKHVCEDIGIFDIHGKPNDQYIEFVGEHINWSSHTRGDPFREEISSREKARQYVTRHFVEPINQ